ncbi:hypothetical protein O6H91_01G067400 [Diphasiastrum complanatum]|uniref:Uncharacterized protein n=1 Tax=Diphasiastrum complanatum TaxID=34168 RepID=A0ACC2ERT6_DIPCM|nr:hypothetical protein O6H91_01G067400 [Diphasiastrum complanatum]
MKHRNAFRKLGRTSSHRWALLRNLVSELVRHERIETTVPKAKELRRVADNMVQLGKEGTLHALRQAAAVVHGDEILHKLFHQLAMRYKTRAGGYTRIVPTRIRQGDAAPMAYIEFVDRPEELRIARPAVEPPPPRDPLPPWLKSRYAQHWAPQKQLKVADVNEGSLGNSV